MDNLSIIQVSETLKEALENEVSRRFKQKMKYLSETDEFTELFARIMNNANVHFGISDGLKLGISQDELDDVFYFDFKSMVDCAISNGEFTEHHDNCLYDADETASIVKALRDMADKIESAK